MDACEECGGEMQPERGDYPDPDLPGVVLLGIEMPRCAKCTASEIEIPHLDGLHRLLASAIVGKRGRLAPSEIRFLRSSTGWTGVEMARHLGVTPEAVSRWENAKDTIGAIADRLVRMVTAAQLGAHAPVEVLTELTDDAAPLALRVRFGHDGWRIVGASDPTEAWRALRPRTGRRCSRRSRRSTSTSDGGPLPRRRARYCGTWEGGRVGRRVRLPARRVRPPTTVGELGP